MNTQFKKQKNTLQVLPMNGKTLQILRLILKAYKRRLRSLLAAGSLMALGSIFLLPGLVHAAAGHSRGDRIRESIQRTAEQECPILFSDTSIPHEGEACEAKREGCVTDIVEKFTQEFEQRSADCEEVTQEEQTSCVTALLQEGSDDFSVCEEASLRVRCLRSLRGRSLLRDVIQEYRQELIQACTPAPTVSPVIESEQATPPSPVPAAAVIPQAATGGCSMMVGGSGVPWSWASLLTMIPFSVLRRWKKKK